MDKVRVYIESDLIPLTEVRPVLSGDFEYKKESGKVYYKHESKDNFKFDDPADWALLQPQIADECGEVSVYVDKFCNGSYIRYWEGFFTIFDSTIHFGRCWLEVKPKPKDEYKCFQEALKEEQNIYSGSGSNITVTAIGGILEEQTCTNFNSGANCGDYFTALNNPDDSCLANPSEWCLKSNTVTLGGEEPGFDCNDANAPFFLEQTTIWHRETIVTNCVDGSPVPPPYGSGWQLLTDDCGGSGTATWWRCPPGTGGNVVGDYTRGRTLEGVFNRVLNNMDCSLTIKSDFYNINPVGDAPNNAAYAYAAANLHNLTIHQKSDIKRKDATNFSTSEAWNIKTKDFWEDLRKMHNVWYIIVDGVLILEHYSYFTSALGWDLSGEPMTPQIDFSGNENILSEKFYWADESSYAFKNGNTILYDCGEEEKEQRCVLFSTDIEYIENPNNADRVSDEGFVMIANVEVDGNLVILDNNEPMKWANLLPALHQHARLYKSGQINGVQQDFLSWLPYIKQEKFKTDFCCSGSFDPANLITTNLTPTLVTATVDTATHNIFTGRMELELNY